MNTLYLLMAEFETGTPTLSQICVKYLGMQPSTAERRANAGKLKLPTFRLSDSQKSPRLVHLQDLAHFIDEARKKGKDEVDAIHD